MAHALMRLIHPREKEMLTQICLMLMPPLIIPMPNFMLSMIPVEFFQGWAAIMAGWGFAHIMFHCDELFDGIIN